MKAAKRITFVMRIERVCPKCYGRGYPPYDDKVVCAECAGNGVTVEERDVTKEVNGAMGLANVAKLAAVMIGKDA